MAPIEPPAFITLRIKVAPGHIPDGVDEFTLGTTVPTESTIGQVQQRIEQVVTSNPPSERQRLLYGGRGLFDLNQTLADALNTKRTPTQTVYVMHLLVRGNRDHSVPGLRSRPSGTPERTESPLQTGVEDGPRHGPSAQPQVPEAPQPLPPQAYLTNRTQAPEFAGSQFRLPPQLSHNGPHSMAAQAQPATGGPPANYYAGLAPGFALPHPQVRVEVRQDRQPSPGGAPNVGESQYQSQSTGQPNFNSDREGVRHSSDAANTPLGNQHAAHQPFERPFSGQGVHLEGIGPNGQRFTIHQQTLSVPHHGVLGVPGHGFPLGFPMGGMGGPPPFGIPMAGVGPSQHFAMPAPAAPGPSALDRSRQNIADMMSELQALQSLDATTDEQRQHIERLRESTRLLNDYIDPFRLGNQAGTTPTTAMPMPAMPHFQVRQQPLQPVQMPPLPGISMTPSAAQPNSSNVSAYLLSSPTGPAAVLYSPEYGMFTGRATNMPYNTSLSDRQPSPTPTSHLTNAASHGDGSEVVLNQATASNQGSTPAPAPADAAGGLAPPAAAPPAQVQAAAQPDAMAPILAHFWLLLRVLIFAYFVLGSNMGWRRPLALLGIGFGFWMIRAGLFGDGGVLRRWWEGIIQIPQRPVPDAEAGQGRPAAPEEQAPGRMGRAAGGAMPTPEQVAQRLLGQDARARDEARQARVHWLRERVRPAERAAALFVASLWPGVGEAHVRAREQEERRRAEEEVAARRRAEEQEQERLRVEKDKTETEKTGEQEGQNGSHDGSLGRAEHDEKTNASSSLS